MNPYEPGDKVNYLLLDNKKQVYEVSSIYGPQHVALSIYGNPGQGKIVNIANIKPAKS